MKEIAKVSLIHYCTPSSALAISVDDLFSGQRQVRRDQAEVIAAFLLASVACLDVLHTTLEAEIHLLAFLDTHDDVIAKLVNLVQ